MIEETIKSIVAKFLKISPDLINDNTIIDTSVLKGSVLFHRMISRVNEACNIEIKDYNKIKTYFDITEAVKKARSIS